MVLAGAANVAKFMAAAKPIYDRLEGDPLTATALGAIQALKTATPPSAPTAACRPPVSTSATIPPVEPGPPIGMIPDGTYRQPANSMADLLTKGLTPSDARNNAGTWSMVVHGSTLTWTLTNPSGQVAGPVCPNTLVNEGDRIRETAIVDCEPSLELRWSLDGDQLNLTIANSTPIAGYDMTIFEALLGGPWTKVE